MRRLDLAKTLVAATIGATFATSSRARADDPVSVMYAASLVTVMERAIVPALAKHGVEVRGEARGSVTIAKLIAAGSRAPDVFVSADPKIIESLMGSQNKNLATWYAIFGTTRLVVGYAANSAFAADFVAVRRGEKKITDALLTPSLRLGRTDPALDPKGYRSILAAKLLEADFGPTGFAAKLLGSDRNPAQILPEETLLARLETGDLDAGFLYATESKSRGLPAIELPKTANLGYTNEAVHYSTVSVTIDGVKRVGAPAAYALTIPTVALNPGGAASFVSFLLSSAGSALLRTSGVTTLRPILIGDRNAVPASVLGAIEA